MSVTSISVIGVRQFRDEADVGDAGGLQPIEHFHQVLVLHRRRRRGGYTFLSVACSIFWRTRSCRMSARIGSSPRNTSVIPAIVDGNGDERRVRR